MLFSSLASAGDPVQMWKCNVNGDVAEEAVMAQAAAWKKAAGELAGGDEMNVYTMFPVSLSALTATAPTCYWQCRGSHLAHLASGGMPTPRLMSHKWSARP